MTRFTYDENVCMKMVGSWIWDMCIIESWWGLLMGSFWNLREREISGMTQVFYPRHWVNSVTIDGSRWHSSFEELDYVDFDNIAWKLRARPLGSDRSRLTTSMLWDMLLNFPGPWDPQLSRQYFFYKSYLFILLFWKYPTRIPHVPSIVLYHSLILLSVWWLKKTDVAAAYRLDRNGDRCRQ